MDSFEFNKLAAAILIALLTVKGASLLSEQLVQPKILKENAYKIKGAETSGKSEGSRVEQKGPTPIEPLLAFASAENGAIVFKKCTSCHTIEKGGPNRIGPNLYGIVGAKKANHLDYSYSQAMTQKGGVWTYDDLNVYLFNPRHFVPGTKMSFIGIKDDKERADVITYIRQHTENPPPLSSAPSLQGSPMPKPKSD